LSAYPPVSDPDAFSDPTLAALLTQLNERHNGAICSTLVYGSCLRSGDIYDGLLDLYLICDGYRAAYHRPLLATANRLLPPNVFYAEHKHVDGAESGQTLRAKVTVISLRDFQRGCSTSWFESYIWGRFAQPTHILYARDSKVRAQIEASLILAARTLLHNALPLLPQEGSLNTLWTQSLKLSYTTELRTERSGRAQELALSSSAFYAALTRHHARQLGYSFELYEEKSELHYRTRITPSARRIASLSWALRRGHGKMLSILRLTKALFTFAGALDYVAWKLERHSGEKILIPDKVRRRPLIHMWGYFWGLYRRGIFK
jgi:hypothetical protein